MIAGMLLASAPPVEVADFTGIYINGFERSEVVVCDGPMKGERLWRPGYGAREAAVIEGWRKGRGETAFPFLFIEFSGALSAPGAFGPLGRHDYQVTAVDVRLARVATDADMKRCGLE
jgi:hypothetical protein